MQCKNKRLTLLLQEDWEILEDIMPIMGYIEQAIREVSSDTYPTGSMVIPLIVSTIDAIEAVEPKTPEGLLFQTKLLSEIDTRLKTKYEKKKLLCKAMLLDPRYKKEHFHSAMVASEAVIDIENQIKKKPLTTHEPIT